MFVKELLGVYEFNKKLIINVLIKNVICYKINDFNKKTKLLNQIKEKV